MGTFLIAFQTVLPLFLIIIVGILFSRSKACSENWIEVLNKYALWIGFPALIISSLIPLEIAEQSYTKLIIYNSAIYIFCILLAFPIARIFRFSNKMRQALILILPFGNIAYLGMPILKNALGDEILPVAALISAVYIFWLLTLALFLIEILGEQKLNPKKQFLSLIQNPLLLSVFVGLALVLLKIKLPLFAEKTIHLFGSSVTAIVLFSLGIFLGMQKIGKLKEWYKVFGIVVFTMLVLPFVFFQILLPLNFDSSLLKATVIDSAMPLGLTPYALSVQYKLETTLVARIVVLGTFLSMIIIPFWIMYLG